MILTPPIPTTNAWFLAEDLEAIPVPDQLPRIDASRQSLPTPADIVAFLAYGAIAIDNFLCPDEIERWRRETQPFITRALERIPRQTPMETTEAFSARIASPETCFSDQPPGAPDTWYGLHQASGRIVPRMIDFNLDKSAACRRALANPFLLTFAEMAMGKDFVQMFDAMILKMEGSGFQVGWHRDRHEPFAEDPRWPTIVPGIYLDDSDVSTAIRIVPGSHRLTQAAAKDLRKRCVQDGFDAPYMAAFPVPAGTMIIHHAHVLHGSPEGCGGLRRVQYLGMRTIEAARDKWSDALIRACHRRHFLCIAERLADPRYRGEQPYHYRADVSTCSDADGWQDLPPYRILQHPHTLRIPRHEGAAQLIGPTR